MMRMFFNLERKNSFHKFFLLKMSPAKWHLSGFKTLIYYDYYYCLGFFSSLFIHFLQLEMPVLIAIDGRGL